MDNDANVYVAGGPDNTILKVTPAGVVTTLRGQVFRGSADRTGDVDWKSSREQAIRDTTVPPKDDRESAIFASLIPGPYTAIVRGKDGRTGVALVEVYALQ